MATISSNSYT